MALLLSDARLPTGAHVHSGGMEQAVDDALVRDVSDLAQFLRGRLLSAGRLSAHVAALACALASPRATRGRDAWRILDDEVSARIVSPALRATSRRQGRSLLRTGAVLFDHPLIVTLDALHADGPHLAMVQGVVAECAGLDPLDAALLAAYGVVTGAASAALRLLGLDPLAVAAVEADLASMVDEVATTAAAAVGDHPSDLPATAAPVAERLAQRHAARKERLFAS